MKALKKIVIIFGILLLVIVGGIYAATLFIDKEVVQQQISKSLGRELVINGEISPQIGLSPTIKITDVVLANAEWGSKKPLAKIGEVEVTLQLLPLLSSAVQIDSLSLKNSEISLEKSKGKWNFEFADAKEEGAAEKQEAQTDATKISIGDIAIENVTIAVKDGKTSNYKISKLNLGAGESFSPIDLLANIDGQDLSVNGEITSLSKILENKIVELNDSGIKSGKYSAQASLKADLNKAKPYVSGSISMGALDFSSKESSAESTGEKKVDTELYSKKPLPFEALSAVNADITISIKSLKINDKVTLQNAKLPAKIAGGILNVKNITTTLSGTKIKADLKLSKSSSSLTLNTSGLKAGELFIDNFSGGATDLQTSLKMSGNSVHSLVSSLSGNTKIHLKDAIYSGAVKDGALKQLFKLLTGGTASAKTEINCVIADIEWNNGNGEFKNLGIVTDHAVVTGDGKIKLPTQKVKMTVVPKARNIGLTDLLVPPIAISGKFDNLSVYPEPKGTAISALKTAAGIATGVGIFAKIGEVIGDKTGISESLGITAKNPCLSKEE